MTAKLMAVCLSLGIAMAPVAAFAIQNIGFPDDPGGNRMVVSKADVTSFQAAQKGLLGALATLAKFDGVDGESKEVINAMRAIGSNASIIEAIAMRAGNKELVTFMATVKSWSTSGDADDRPADLVRKIDKNVMQMKAGTK